MAPTNGMKKRKALAKEDAAFSDAESDAEFGDGVLEGILSHSESEDDSEQEDVDVASEIDDSELESLGSDEIPSEDEADDSKALNIRQADADKDAPNYRIERDANGGERYVYDEIEPGYDSDDSDAQEGENTIGNIPLSFYDSYPHIGYNINGKKIMRPAKGEALDALLDSIEVPKGWTGLTDPATGKPLSLSSEELEVLRKIQMNEVPEEGYDPYPVRRKTTITLTLY